MPRFVIVHGGWGGGWEWTPVARLLRAQGHETFTPTLTGMGERAHLGLGEEVDLAVHVQDVVAVLQFEDLRDVVLCGASYGGMPVTAAADQVPDRIGLVVYIDALVPTDGQSALDLLPPSFGDLVRSGAADNGPGWRVPLPSDLLRSLLPEAALAHVQRDHLVSRIRDQPAATFTAPVRLNGAVDRLPRAFVRCTAGDHAEFGADPIAPLAARAKAAGWPYRELSAPHDPHLFDPRGVADVLHELATALGLAADQDHQGVSTVWPVAGCLFEVALPARDTSAWHWTNPTPDVTLLAQEVRGERQHLRFRAEQPCSGLGAVELRFLREGEHERRIHVQIAPEQTARPARPTPRDVPPS